MCIDSLIEVNHWAETGTLICQCVTVCDVKTYEQLQYEVEELRALLLHPTVKAVVELVQEAEHQYNRAEHAHTLKDEANQRWLDAVSK